MGERSHGKGKVSGSSPDVGTKKDDFMMHHLHITLKAFEPKVLYKVSHTLQNICSDSFFQRVGLPTLKKYITVLRSPHVHKKSREQFVMHQYKTMLRMKSDSAVLKQRTLFACKHLPLSGVQMKQVIQYSSPLWAAKGGT